MANAPPPTPGAAPPDRRALGRWLAEQQLGPRTALRRAGVCAALAGALAVPQAWLLAQAIAAAVMTRAPLVAVLPWLAVVPLLALTFLFGPAGLLAFFALRAVLRPASLRPAPGDPA